MRPNKFSSNTFGSTFSKGGLGLKNKPTLLDIMSAMISDCIVLKIVETEATSGDTDNTIYVLYDNKAREYIIRGVRSPSYKTVFDTYSFRCHSTKVVGDFLYLTIDGSNIVSYALYNCNDLPYSSDEITSELLDESCVKRVEVIGYDNMKLERKTLQKYVDIVGNMFNPY